MSGLTAEGGPHVLKMVFRQEKGITPNQEALVRFFEEHNLSHGITAHGKEEIVTADVAPLHEEFIPHIPELVRAWGYVGTYLK